MDPRFDADRQAVIDEVRRFVEREVVPVAHDMEHDDIYPLELIEKLKTLGVFSATIPEAYGGLGFDFYTYSQIIEQLARGWMSLAGIVNTHILLAYMIATYGTEEQRRAFLPVMAQGERRGGICLSEANAGSDVQAITMTARRDGSDYLLDGSKLWVTNGQRGSIFAVLARTDSAMSGLEVGRINVAARAVGVAQAAFDDAIRYAQQRHTFGKPIAQHQAIQLKLADMATKIEAARLLLHHAAQKKDRGERCDMEAGMAKLFATEMCQEVTLEAMRIFGGYGYTTEFNVERYYRDAPFMLVAEGTSEIQRLVIARQLLERYKL